MYKTDPVRYFHLLIIAMFIVLSIFLFKLQIIDGNKYTLIAENNILRIRSILPVRGEIFDKKFRPIAVNHPSINIYITPAKIANLDKLIDFLNTHFNLDSETVTSLLHESRFRSYQEILLLQNIEEEKLIKGLELFNYFPSLSYKTEAIRHYYYPNHFSGYQGRINETEYEELKQKGYTINSFLGKTGIEKYYETILRGENGYQIIQVDASGRNLHLLRYNLDKPAQNGANLILTIDNDLQTYIMNLIPSDMKGAVIVMNPSDGGILAYVSIPEFDQNVFSSNMSNKDWDKIINDPAKPMLDRVIHGAYPPASVFKPVVAALGLEKNIITELSTLTACDGGMTVGNRYFKCWWEKGHGSLSVIDAIKYSCDVFFYDLSLKLELDELSDFTRKNMITVKTNIDLPGERNGFFPTEKWYIKQFGKYVPIIGHKVNLSIGQGELLTTPLQICAYYAALSNDGIWHQPHFLSKTIRGDYTREYLTGSYKLPISEENLELLNSALWKTVNESYGTGVAASLKNVRVYGKTGSAENHMGEETHAWFAGYAKSDNFCIAYTIFLENAGSGGGIAAPLAAKIISYYQGLEK
jgi:penicillin-binding protein 2